MEQKRSQKESDYLPKRGNPLQETVVTGSVGRSMKYTPPAAERSLFLTR